MLNCIIFPLVNHSHPQTIIDLFVVPFVFSLAFLCEIVVNKILEFFFFKRSPLSKQKIQYIMLLLFANWSETCMKCIGMYASLHSDARVFTGRYDSTMNCSILTFPLFFVFSSSALISLVSSSRYRPIPSPPKLQLITDVRIGHLFISYILHIQLITFSPCAIRYDRPSVQELE